jgi:hypothetical protein
MRGEKRSEIILRGEDESQGTVGCKTGTDSLAIVAMRAQIEVRQSKYTGERLPERNGCHDFALSNFALKFHTV